MNKEEYTVKQLPQLLTEKAAAKMLGWSVSALQQRRFRGQLPPYLKLDGKSVRYEASALQEFIEKSRVHPGEEVS